MFEIVMGLLLLGLLGLLYVKEIRRDSRFIFEQYQDLGRQACEDAEKYESEITALRQELETVTRQLDIAVKALEMSAGISKPAADALAAIQQSNGEAQHLG